MKTVTALPAPAMSCKPRVKKLLVIGIIYLTSEKFVTFVGAIAVLLAWWGACSDNAHVTASGVIAGLLSCMPWIWRQVARDIRQDSLGQR